MQRVMLLFMHLDTMQGVILLFMYLFLSLPPLLFIFCFWTMESLQGVPTSQKLSSSRASTSCRRG
jgi:hypothetical protein